jgi:hypothetical protein
MTKARTSAAARATQHGQREQAGGHSDAEGVDSMQPRQEIVEAHLPDDQKDKRRRQADAKLRL